MNKTFKLGMLVLVVIAVLVNLMMVIQADAKEYHVSSLHGNDNNDGSDSSPWKTLTYSSKKLIAGDVLVINGNFNETLNPLISGNISHPITFKGTSSSQKAHVKNIVVSSKQYIIFQNLRLGGDDTYIEDEGAIIYGASRNVTFRNIDVSKTKRCGIIIHSGFNHKIIDCNVSYCDRAGIVFYGPHKLERDKPAVSESLIQGCYAHHNGGDGICLHYENSFGEVAGRIGDNNRIIDNICENNDEDGIDIVSGNDHLIEGNKIIG